MKKLLSILALALCFVACQNEGVENATNGDLVNVVLTVDAPELGATRADADASAGKNSAFGAIDFFNDVGLNYVSCSPPRVPVARLAAAQAQLKK